MKRHLFVPLFLLLILLSCQRSETGIPGQSGVTAENALASYLDNDDPTFSWEVRTTYDIAGVKVYDLLLTSQTWREHRWVHQLTILVPPENNYDGALLYLNGRGIRDGEPDWRGSNEITSLVLAQVALKNKAITAVLWQVPNQPLYDNLSEDALISYTLHQFKADGDFTWPLLFPMVKSAVKAMDAIQEFSQEELAASIDRFVLTGASKRGWTSWLTGAADQRVAAIAPMVIDVLNMPVNLQYQLDVWNDYSPQINDYVDLGIVQEVETGRGPEIARMIDPYAYRANLTMPKLIVIGTNDEYWPVDAIKHYIDNIPGENLITYLPNAGHDLGGGEAAIRAISAFFGQTLNGAPHPQIQWDLNYDSRGISLEVNGTMDALQSVALWWADSEDRDFRDASFTKQDLDLPGGAELTTPIDYPDSGFRAFYVDLEYADANGGTYTLSTRMFVADTDEVFVD
ncbi:PhoPQ-activated pathogenicity-related family protein [Flavilitoribacter nigricans]|uniref:PhoPQ-activated pathogenicity-like protein PqaA type n=1 Tax=Flavilitoribacter nigricans (strain ATCC 23147 / DSM 23189 / NBRC 102662 / NCIMB 1420 / SS-2) TaxID=1122177 RepID=A0A2D0N1P0_FLAN2|nr:PhoPQ-activated protein PqaA family protein [Flavilitoribacter nigricans]PHN02415.1 PhoPQ-activated pathogenicity-like protein PqaA type [Flavilitoribacter nigricans DSM 23189 = NBRC 102662]